MTCTHAALKRRDLIESGFQYDNILMEETAQILEIETFIPLLLQVPKVSSAVCCVWKFCTLGWSTLPLKVILVSFCLIINIWELLIHLLECYCILT